MRIAIFGATSQIAKDLVQSFEPNNSHELVLFTRRPEVLLQWMKYKGFSESYRVADFNSFGLNEKFDAIINFVGVGNPSLAIMMGAKIFDITLQYDELAINYIRIHSECRYIFLSSGAAYGDIFEAPVDEKSMSQIAINKIKPQDWYGVAKLHAECRHRALAPLPIVDIRIFNYFSRTQDLEASFLISQVMRAIVDKRILRTSSDSIMRDFMHPLDFYNLVNLILLKPPVNNVVDAYTKAPIDKLTLLNEMSANFGLVFDIVQSAVGDNATGIKSKYYSINRSAHEFSYIPKYSSLDGVLVEANAILSSSKIT